jgi:hypothetical protein
MLRAQGNELFYAYIVGDQAIVIPETIDPVRGLSTRAFRNRSCLMTCGASI